MYLEEVMDQTIQMHYTYSMQVGVDVSTTVISVNIWLTSTILWQRP